MTARYELRIYSPQTGGLVAVVTDWNSVYYSKRINDTSTHTISLDRNHPAVKYIIPDALLEVWRYDPLNGIVPYREYLGLHRTSQSQSTDRNDRLFTSYGRSPIDLLHRRSVLYYAGTAQDAKSGLADDVMKAYVRENAGTLATVANGRIIDGQTAWLAVAADASQGPSWSGSAAWENLLEAIQKIATASQIDFDVVRAGDTTFTFRTYLLNGTDRSSGSAKVEFSQEFANMSLPYLTQSRVDEVNDVITLGQGEGNARQWVEVADTTTQADSPWNRIEKIVDARDANSLAELTARGTQAVNDGRAVRKISFTVLQRGPWMYGRDYFNGDRVMTTFDGISQAKRLTNVENTVSSGKEDIRIHFDNDTSAGA